MYHKHEIAAFVQQNAPEEGPVRACVAVRRVGVYGGWSTSAVGLYVAHRRSRDGVWTWRLVRDISSHEYTTSKGGQEYFERIMAASGVPRIDGVRHGTPLTDYP